MDAELKNDGEAYEVEVLDGELVELEPGELTQTDAGQITGASSAAVERHRTPVLQAAAVGAAGFVAGAATLALVRKYVSVKAAEQLEQQRALAPTERRGWLEGIPARGRTYIVHVRPLQPPE